MFGATAAGFRRAFGSPMLVLAAWLLTVLAALPVTVVLGYSLQQSFGRTLAAEPMAEGFDNSWYGEYLGSAKGIEQTFDPTLAGVGGVLANLEAWADGSTFERFSGLIGLALLFALVWALFLGGAIERYAFADGPRGIAAMLNAGGRYWGRFVRLALLSGAVYYGVYRLHHWLMDGLEVRLTDVTEETRAMWATLAVYAGTALLLVLVRACFDYAKIAIVIEDRRSALLSAVQGVVFVVTHPIKATGVVLLIAAVAVAITPASAAVTVTPATGGSPTSTTTTLLAVSGDDLFDLRLLLLRDLDLLLNLLQPDQGYLVDRETGSTKSAPSETATAATSAATVSILRVQERRRHEQERDREGDAREH